MNIPDELKDYGLRLRESDNPERSFIDFSIEDDTDNVFWCWGDSFDDIDWECDHPYQCIEFGDDRDEQGECLLCGSYCDFHYSPDDEGHATPEPHEWYPRRDVGGLISRYLEELRAENA